MMHMIRRVAVFMLFHPYRWLFTLASAASGCILAVAMVLAQTAFLPGHAPCQAPAASAVSAPVPDAFGSERLKAFSGLAFDLLPDLDALLDSWKPASAENNGAVPTAVLAFINPEFVTFTEYTIARGDNYWKVAKQFGYTIDTIVGCNPQLERVACYNGQRILLPSRGGCLHQVDYGEDLAAIALDYRVDPEAVVQANCIDEAWGLVPGMWLFIPGAKPLHLNQGMHQQYTTWSFFRSPLCGRYTSFVGNRIHPILGFSKFHNGVDIACKLNSWVGASAAGTVVAAGWGDAVGKYIKVDHHNGFQSLYGHLNAIYVHTGQKVKSGQLIGRSGNTGRSTGPHLHFTIWENGRVKDPMKYLK